ncbi:MAG: proprotein convertase P-domain-containing protein [Bryobacterales bacterium]
MTSPQGTVLDVTRMDTGGSADWPRAVINQFHGEQANGTWTIRIRDAAGAEPAR